jgi:hypothetical protein
MVELQQKYEMSMMEFRRSLEELDLKRMGQMMDYFSKVITERENFEIHKELRRDDGAGLGTMEATPGNQGVIEDLAPGVAGDYPDAG